MGCTESSLEQVLDEKNIYCTVEKIECVRGEHNEEVWSRDFKAILNDSSLDESFSFDISDDAYGRIAEGYTTLWKRTRYTKDNTGKQYYKYQIVANDLADAAGEESVSNTEQIGVKVIQVYMTRSSNRHTSVGVGGVSTTRSSASYSRYVKYLDNETGEIRSEKVEQKAYETAKNNLGNEFKAIRQTYIIPGGNLDYKYQLVNNRDWEVTWSK